MLGPHTLILSSISYNSVRMKDAYWFDSASWVVDEHRVVGGPPRSPRRLDAVDMVSQEKRGEATGSDPAESSGHFDKRGQNAAMNFRRQQLQRVQREHTHHDDCGSHRDPTVLLSDLAAGAGPGDTLK